MRCLVVHPGPHFSVADVCDGWVRGLANAGAGVQVSNLDETLDFFTAAHLPRGDEMVRAFERNHAIRLAANEILVDAFNWWPQVVIIVSCLFVPPDVVRFLRGRGMHVVLLATESPYEDERQIAQAAHFDTVIVNDPLNLDLFREANPNSHYIGHAFDPGIHYDDERRRSGVCFVGTGFPSRVELLEAVDWSGLDLSLAGFWRHLDKDSPLRKHLIGEPDECYDNDQTAELYRSSLAGFNSYRREHYDGPNDRADGIACGPREIEMAACGLPFVRDARPESDELFPFLPTYETPEELEFQLRWLVADPDRAVDLGRRARAAVARRTFASNAAQLLRIIDL